MLLGFYAIGLFTGLTGNCGSSEVAVIKFDSANSKGKLL